MLRHRWSFFFFVGFLYAGTASAIPVIVSNAPENNLGLTLQTIKSARHSLWVNAYELSSSPIGLAIQEKINEGLQVIVLKEGQPVAGMSSADKEVANSLITAMIHFNNLDHFFLMNAPRASRRFVFDHAKYIVVDQQDVLVGSENYSPGGQPEGSTLGNRGWQMLIHDSGIANIFGATFKSDATEKFGDVQDLKQPIHTALMLPPEQGFVQGGVQMEADAIEPIFSPQTSLNGLLKLLNSARRTIDVELMSFSLVWKDRASPLSDALFQAASRGVKVRVILNDDASSFHKKSPNNWDLAKHLNQMAKSKNITLVAKVANLKAMHVKYIHNKGVLVDGNLTLISSINWTENAVQKNREAAVLVAGKNINSYFHGLYDFDWAQ